MIRLLTAAVLALGLALAPAAAQTTLRVGDQKGGSRALMEAAGALDGLSYTVEWKEFPAAAPLLEALNAGAIDTGYVGDAPFTFAVAAGAPIKAVFAVRSQQEGLAVMVRPDSPAKTFADLKGKRIATGRGSIGHELLLASLEKAGLKPDDIKLRPLLPADARAALLSDSIDAWSTWEPYTSQLEVAGAARSVGDGRGITPGLSVLAARTDAIEGKRAALEDFVRRIARARIWGTTHPEPYAQSWSKLVGLPAEVGVAWFKRADIRPVPIDDTAVADAQTVADLYQRNRLIPKPLDMKGAFDASFNAAAKAGAESATQ